MAGIGDYLQQINQCSQEVFQNQKRILSFQQYLDAFCAQPVRLGRNAAQYVLDVFEHFGTRQVEGIGGLVPRWNLFDAPWDHGRDALCGQELVQAEIHRHLRRFAVTGRADKLILLHGPNGSAKSTIINLIVRALEYYSTLPDGALFRFNWIFSDRSESRGMGFGTGRDDLPKETLAHIDEALISCRISSEMKEPPIFLLPVEYRARLLEQLSEAAPQDTLADRLRGEFLREGQLSTKNKLIFDTLMNAHHGDWLKVIRHVQVERYFISRRYLTGAAVIEPQQVMDGGARPVNFEHGVSLPPVLQTLPLTELVGELVEANGGIVEFSDLLKRNLELNKYLLTTVETGEVHLPGAVARLNLVMLGTCNEKQLSAFKLTPDFSSYKGRIELVRVPYLLEWRKERAIYDRFIEEIREMRHVAPHTGDVVALWAVLTRLRRPDPGRYSAEAAAVVRRLTPLDKAKLYHDGAVPDGFSIEDAKLLRSIVPQLRDEHREMLAEFEGFICTAFEGRRGASAREIKSLLAEAAALPRRQFLSPLAMFEVMERVLRDKSVFEFLRLDSDEGYYDCDAFIEQLKNEYFHWVSVEVYDSMGLVAEAEYDRRIQEYFRHVRAYVAGEKIQNPRTGQFEDPSNEVMGGLEEHMGLKEPPDSFRRNLMTRVAAFSLEHPDEKINYHDAFTELFQNLRTSYYREKARALVQLAEYVLVFGTEDGGLIPLSERPRVERTLALMREKYGYTDDSAKEAISFVLRRVQEMN